MRTLIRTLFAFLSYNHSTSAISILHSLIFQLTSDNEELQTALCELGQESLKSNIDVAVGIISKLLACAGSVYIIIDGLDEIDEFQRTLFVENIINISEKCKDVRILISSRVEADLKAQLGDKTSSIRVDGPNAGSIQTFIRNWMQNWFQRRRIPPQDRKAIEGWLAPLAWRSKGFYTII